MPLDEAMVGLVAERYLRERDRYLKLARLVEGECQATVSKHRIAATVQSRAKTPESFEQKLLGYITKGKADKIAAVNSPDDAIRITGDLAGVRVATYVEGDRQRVIGLLKLRFGVRDEDVEDHRDEATGYRATHLQVLLPPELGASADSANIRDTTCEIQVCSMLAHVYNEVEHDIRYKDAAAAIEEPFIVDRLDMLRGRTHDGDDYIEQLLILHSAVVARRIMGILAAEFPGCPEFERNAVEVITEIVRLGYDTAARIKDELLRDDRLAVAGEQVERINLALERSDEATRLDPTTADCLLAILLSLHASDVKAVHLRELEGNEALRVARIAQACIEFGVFEV